MITFNVITAFPEVFPGTLGVSVMGRAINKGILNINVVPLRDFACDVRMDDTPYGGGPGMVIRADVLGHALDYVLNSHIDTKKILMSPSGKLFDNKMALDLSKHCDITLVCGRFEGIDARVLDFYSFDEISIGNYILSGGEVAAMSLIEACSRFVPGVLGNPQSLFQETFSLEGYVEHPHYTRPRVWKGIGVDPVLLSGHHFNIESWRSSKYLKK